jgi:hypothetical protein
MESRRAPLNELSVHAPPAAAAAGVDVTLATGATDRVSTADDDEGAVPAAAVLNALPAARSALLPAPRLIEARRAAVTPGLFHGGIVRETR